MSERRFLLYFAWSRERECAAPLEKLENRYPTLFEFRHAVYPHYEHFSDPKKHDQFLAGFLDHVVLSDFENFRHIIQSETNHLPEIVQREHDAGESYILNDELLSKTDTAIIISLDHHRSNQQILPEEVEAVNKFLLRDSSCLFVCPHHFIGDLEDTRIAEHNHHGDVLVPSEQKIGQYGIALLEKIGVSVKNVFGLSPGRSSTGEPSLLIIDTEADELGVLAEVRTFNLHPHLPHFEISKNQSNVRILARQDVNLNVPSHPTFKEKAFNSFLWVPPSGSRQGNIFVCDATLWSSAFRGLASLEILWRNLAKMRI